MKYSLPALPHWSLNAPVARSESSYRIDAIALTVYLAAIAYGAMLLAIPNPWIVAGAMIVVSLAAISALQNRRGATVRSE